jgi:hypothetical protein
MTSGYQVVLGDKSLREIVTEMVDQAGFNGITVAEAREHLPARHHGHVSGVFSVLHQRLAISRLTEERDGYKIYVDNDRVLDRPTETQGRGGPSKAEIEWFMMLDSHLEYWTQPDDSGSRFCTDMTKAERNKPLFVKETQALYARRPRVGE